MAITSPNTGKKQFDLEDRTEKFADDVRKFVKRLSRTFGNTQDIPQLVRASGSPAANYIEANEALGKKDFLMKIRTCRREAKESGLWLRLMDVGDNSAIEKERQRLNQEAKELELIFGSILRNSQ
jgi:four helix bundle protein